MAERQNNSATKNWHRISILKSVIILSCNIIFLVFEGTFSIISVSCRFERTAQKGTFFPMTPRRDRPKISPRVKCCRAHKWRARSETPCKTGERARFPIVQDHRTSRSGINRLEDFLASPFFFDNFVSYGTEFFLYFIRKIVLFRDKKSYQKKRIVPERVYPSP